MQVEANFSGIYGLADPRNGAIVYVGRAIDASKRYESHLIDGEIEGRDCLKWGWVRWPIIRTKRNCLAYLWLEGVTPELVQIEVCPKDIDQQDFRERYWGHRLAEAGHPLSNGSLCSIQFSMPGKSPAKRTCPYSAGLIKSNPRYLPQGYLRRPVTFGITLADLPECGRLHRDRPDLFEKIKTRSLTPHAAMIEAGFRQPTSQLNVNPSKVGEQLARRWSAEQFDEIVRVFRLAKGLPTD